MWIKAENREALYEALEKVNKKDFGEYVSGKEQWQGPGWYWCDTRRIYFGRGAHDHITQALTAEERIRELKEEIGEIVGKLVEARRVTRGEK